MDAVRFFVELIRTGSHWKVTYTHTMVGHWISVRASALFIVSLFMCFELWDRLPVRSFVRYVVIVIFVFLLSSCCYRAVLVFVSCALHVSSSYFHINRNWCVLVFVSGVEKACTLAYKCRLNMKTTPAACQCWAIQDATLIDVECNNCICTF